MPTTEPTPESLLRRLLPCLCETETPCRSRMDYKCANCQTAEEIIRAAERRGLERAERIARDKAKEWSDLKETERLLSKALGGRNPDVQAHMEWAANEVAAAIAWSKETPHAR